MAVVMSTDPSYITVAESLRQGCASLGHWMAGFIAGEGHFDIHPTGVAAYRCRCQIGLRDDDAPILRQLRRDVGFGSLYYYEPYQANANPQVRWTVGRKRDCFELVQILDHYPMRAKKRDDYEIWRQAVLAWQKIDRNQQNDFTELAALKARLDKTRVYGGDPGGYP